MGSELIKWDHHHRDLESKFDWISNGFRQAMMSRDFNPLVALRSRVSIAPPPTLRWEEFSHFGELQSVALTYVRSALASGAKGVNLLLHGAPGVGKTEFSRAMAQKLGCDIYEVSTEDEDGDPIDSTGRLRALRLMHTICSNRRALMVFDEIEDIFPVQSPFGRTAPAIKGWVNRILENNPAVTIWITNAVEAIDSAFVRRFDLVIEVKRPPAPVREAQLRSLPVSLPEESVRAMVSCSHLAPAVVSRAAKVVAAIQSELRDGALPQTMRLIVNETLQAQGYSRLRIIGASDHLYDPGYVNADVVLGQLPAGLRSAKSARICLYGPPGTGKTAFGHWLAKQLGTEIITKRASELLGPFVGLTEQHIARAFREAADSDSMLLIDEVDSFLRDRTKAVHSWQVTQVNELLVQMEQFEGIFIASTNLMTGLDAAALRRFDLKVKFDYMRPEQSRRLLAAHLAAAGVPSIDPTTLNAIDSLRVLTPGDFAAVARQHRFNPLTSVAAWVAALERECTCKPSFDRQVIGFGRYA
jgi:AAA+ superfamily predicted ATPase